MAGVEKETAENAIRVGAGKAGPGRPKGVPNKTTTKLKDAILLAAEEAGGENGLVGYLRLQADKEPVAFMSLLGRVLPLTLQGDASHPLVTRIERVIVRPAD